MTTYELPDLIIPSVLVLVLRSAVSSPLIRQSAYQLYVLAIDASIKVAQSYISTVHPYLEQLIR